MKGKMILSGAVLFLLSILSCGPSLSYSIRNTYTDEGGIVRHGHIRINGNSIPEVFTLVITENGTTFRFFQRSGPAGHVGYHPVQPVTVPVSHTLISIEEKNRGWYIGSSRLQKTPADWIFVAWTKGSAFVIPGKIQDLVHALKLEPISHKKTPEVTI